MMVDLMHAMVATPFKKLKELNDVEIQLLLTGAKKGSTYLPISFSVHFKVTSSYHQNGDEATWKLLHRGTMGSRADACYLKSSIPLSTATSSTTSGQLKRPKSDEAGRNSTVRRLEAVSRAI